LREGWVLWRGSKEKSIKRGKGGGIQEGRRNGLLLPTTLFHQFLGHSISREGERELVGRGHEEVREIWGNEPLTTVCHYSSAPKTGD